MLQATQHGQKKEKRKGCKEIQEDYRGLGGLTTQKVSCKVKIQTYV